MYLILKKCVTLPTISFYNMNAMGIGQMILYLGINIADFLIFGSKSLFTPIIFSSLPQKYDLKDKAMSEDPYIRLFFVSLSVQLHN